MQPSRPTASESKLISALHAEILKYINGKDDLVTGICEAEEIKECISTNIGYIMRIIDTLQAATASEPVPINVHPDTSPTQPRADLIVKCSLSTSVESPPTSSDTHPPHNTSPRVDATSYDLT